MIRTGFLAILTILSADVMLLAETAAEGLTKQPDSWFRSEDGRMTMDNILSWQSSQGDWPKNKNTITGKYPGDRSKLKGTFDNGATLGELRALARAYRVVGDDRYKRAFLLGFDHVIAAQYSNGGWPQYFPLSMSYHRHITFNDGSMIRIMEFLTDVAKSENFVWLDQDRRARSVKAIERGIDCILQCQIVVKGKPTVWCAQHDEVTFAPANARSYELASLSGGESAGILKYLMSLESPSPSVVKAVMDGMAWYESVKITGFRYKRSGKEPNLIPDSSARPLWARFYEIETNRPFFCDRDGIVKYDVEEIGSERRGGYAWYGNWGDSLVSTYARWPHRSQVAP